MGNKGSGLYPEPDEGFGDLKAERATRCEGLSLLAITREGPRGQREDLLETQRVLFRKSLLCSGCCGYKCVLERGCCIWKIFQVCSMNLEVTREPQTAWCPDCLGEQW